MRIDRKVKPAQETPSSFDWGGNASGVASRPRNGGPDELVAFASKGGRRAGQVLLANIIADPDTLRNIDTVSTDVFDTLLLRRPVSERARIWRAERLFSQRLISRGFTIDPDVLVDARLTAQRLAYRALNVGGSGEVRLDDIVRRQLLLVGLPVELVAERVALELEVERACLRPNHRLARLLREHRAAGRRVVAISDTALDDRSLTVLIEHFFGTNLFDAVFGSASAGATKRRGDLFGAVAAATGTQPARMLHIGDDSLADDVMPKSLGLLTWNTPRARLHSVLRRMNGAWSELGRRWRRRSRLGAVDLIAYQDARSFGHTVLGPIAAQYCTHVWAYADAAQQTGQTSLLFCARGGVGIRAMYEAVGDALGLPRDMNRDNLLVSRLVAARVAVAARGATALEELAREFHGASGLDVASALGGRDYDLPATWQKTFDATEFYDALDAPEAADFANDIQCQSELFKRHLAQLTAGPERIVLCDTGLYGSMQRLLAEGMPDRPVETVHLARTNYKGHGEEHFARVAGLVVERNRYSPFDRPSCVLRYWQLIERLFEPAVPSVKMLHETPDGAVSSNSGCLAHGRLDVAADNALLAGALDYVSNLSGAGTGQRLMLDAEAAWYRLEKIIAHPTPAEVACIGQCERSVDFGRPGSVKILDEEGDTKASSRFARATRSLWREGAIAREFPKSRLIMHSALTTLHKLRWLYWALRRR